MENKFDVRSLISSDIVFSLCSFRHYFLWVPVVDLERPRCFFPVIAVAVLEKVGGQNL